MPGLAAFCVCTAISLGSIYLLQISWFTAWLSLDEQRIAAGRDGLVPCVVHKDFRPSKWSQRDYGDIVVKKYSKILASHIFKCIVILVTAVFLGFGIWGSLLMHQKFDPADLLPSDSYVRQWKTEHDLHYHGSGLSVYSGEIYSAGFDHSDLHKFEHLSSGLQEILEENIVLAGIVYYTCFNQSGGFISCLFARFQDLVVQVKGICHFEEKLFYLGGVCISFRLPNSFE